MTTYTGSSTDPFPEQLFAEQPPKTYTAPCLPEAHPAEADIFSRFDKIPGHHQDNLANARIMLVGAGGLNSWVACGLVRSGVRELIIVDPDLVERSNLTRQLYYAADLAQPKATCLAHNLIEHSVSRARITGIPLRFEQAVERYPIPTDLLVVGVDRNDCRLSAVRLARQRHIPAIFTMLSLDGLRCHCFLQGPKNEHACLWCALPNLEIDSASPCAASIISSCFLAGAFTTFFIHRALMGWPAGVKPFNWRESDLQGCAPDLTGYIQPRLACPVCSNMR